MHTEFDWTNQVGIRLVCAKLRPPLKASLNLQEWDWPFHRVVFECKTTTEMRHRLLHHAAAARNVPLPFEDWLCATANNIDKIGLDVYKV